ncbi:MAG: hydroxymethylglutaryl-CoA lyase [Gemmobacter sp.]|jgi:hydroxymethylglutaryl-CoA lyase|nr:hydroxymethylglutaryl-CoA lyase [Gemmobacter sp.]
MAQIDIVVTEVGPLDGLQMVTDFMPTEVKKWWVSAMAEAGVPEIDVASFVPPSVIAQFADSDELCRHVQTIPGLSSRAYAPNLKGAERALKCGATYISCGFSSSAEHSLSNYRKSREAQFDQFTGLVELCKCQPEASRPRLQVSFSCVFGCSIQGVVPERDNIDYAVKFIEAGADEIQLCDTVGYADPRQVSRLVKAIRNEIGDRMASLHFHDTRGLGLANVLAGLEQGIIHFDSSIGGLGGCPFAPGATGNINTEDLVFMLEAMGLRTGIDIGRLMAVRAALMDKMPGVAFSGNLARAGLPKGFVPARSAPKCLGQTERPSQGLRRIGIQGLRGSPE